ncbi:flagellar biosynthesis regulator FlaF [Actibacterium mucosum]|nr:flagellar biosynthesis regulator FlaF [Actibacterium mucosum]
MAKTAYANARNGAVRTPRTTEYELFSRVTSQLKVAAEDKANFPALAAALHANRRLWTTLAADVAEPGNQLPEQLRAQLFYLAQFTQHHTSQVLSGAESPEPLIEVNTAVMRGLSAGRTVS